MKNLLTLALFFTSHTHTHTQTHAQKHTCAQKQDDPPMPSPSLFEGDMEEEMDVCFAAIKMSP